MTDTNHITREDANLVNDLAGTWDHEHQAISDICSCLQYLDSISERKSDNLQAAASILDGFLPIRWLDNSEMNSLVTAKELAESEIFMTTGCDVIYNVDQHGTRAQLIK